jgi:two-component system, LuxR family, sensor kinase FixL
VLRNVADRSYRFMPSFLIRGTPRAVLLRAAVLTVAIALIDSRINGDIPLGFLYLFPMLLVGSVVNRWQIALSAAVCAVLTELFDNFYWRFPESIPRDILIFAAFVCMGLYVYEVGRTRYLAMLHLEGIEREAHARKEAEEQLKILVESSPAAVFTATSEGRILLGNEAAHRLFAVAPGTLAGRSIHDFLPSLLNVPAADENHAAFRTAMQCRGHRAGGEVFLADIWFSTYRTSAGPRLAAMVVDASEDLRNREELSLNQLLAGSRILVGAVSYEIRNVCGAIAMAHANLSRNAALDGTLNGSKDFEAMGSLIGALEKIAAIELRNTTDQATTVDLASLLQELRIVVESSLHEQGVHLRLDIDCALPAVWADRQSLIQVFLNLTRNSERAMRGSSRRELVIHTSVERQRVLVTFRDTGCGVMHPERLFHPFQQEARATGLGLYLSRAFMRSFRGDLKYEPEPGGSSFIVELSPVPAGKANYEAADPDSARGRSQPVSREPEPATRSRA